MISGNPFEKLILGKLHRHLIFGYVWIVIAIMSGLILFYPVKVVTAQHKAEKPAHAPASVPSVPVAIPAADVMKRATEVEDILRTINQKAEPSPEIEKIKEMLPEIKARINRDLGDTTIIIKQQPILSVLQAQQIQWQDIKLKTSNWLSILTKHANDFQDSLTHLSELEKTWSTTDKAARTSKAPQPVLERSMEILSALRAAQKPLEKQLALTLDLASRVADEISKCDTALIQIAQAQKKALGGIFVQSNPPITSIELWRGMLSEFPAQIHSITAEYRKDIMRHLHDPYERRPLHAGLFIVLTLIFLLARHQSRTWSAAGEAVSPSMKVFNRPIAAALVVMLFVATSPQWPLPYSVKTLLRFFSLVPMIILVRPVVSIRTLRVLYVLALLFALDTMREVLSGEPLILQVLLSIESLAGIAALIWFSQKLRRLHGVEAGSLRPQFLRIGSIVTILILSAGLAAATTGYTRLSLLLTPSIIFGGSIAVMLYAFVLIMSGVIAFAFRILPLRILWMVHHHRELIEKRIYGFFIWAAIIAWVGRLLNYAGLLGQVLSFGKNVLTAKLERGLINISLGDVLEFLFTVWFAFLLSAFIRFILKEDVYPRLKIAAGKSYAVSSMLHYVIIALGFVAAIGMLGINLNKVTVLAGAFGVGIGFGLQSVVNNFVSGLILLMEQPIHVGDMVEVGDLLGTVRRIGIRASVVRTRHGADIVVPNSQFISEKVTNWTLSDLTRRIDLPVGVSYGAIPKDVISVLEKVANAHPRVLKYPPSRALFTGFGDSSINFELRAWTDQFNDFPQIRSELAVAVFDAVHEAGMTFPFPQREVRILRNHEDESADKQ